MSLRGIAAAWALLLAACAAPEPLDPLPPAPPMSAERIQRDVAWLAADARGGRGAGSQGLLESALYIAEAFGAAGLAPPRGGSHLQPFEMPVSIRVAQQRLSLKGAPFEAGVDFGAFASSDSGIARAEVVFAGYGMRTRDGEWDDYADSDVRGRIVLLLDGLPPAGPASGRRGAGLLLRSEKIATARERGAWAVLLAPSGPEETSPGAAVAAANPSTRSSGLVVLWVSRATAESIVATGGESLDALQAAIDERGEPKALLLPGVQLSAHVGVERRRGKVVNVLGVLRGSDPTLAHEALVIGAHYDHLGIGPYASLSPDRAGEIHNGADDNASGTAGLIELARAFGRAPRPRRSLVFAAFAGEELGLAGSAHYVGEPVFPLADTIAMINLDMIGRLRRHRLTVFGVETCEDFAPLLERAAHGLGLSLLPGRGGFAPSDQTSFSAKGLPVLFFHTGVHRQYHTPDDDSERVDAEGESRVLQLVYRTARALLDADTRPELAAPPPAPPHGAPGGSGYGPYLGTIPDFVADEGPGVRLQGVRRGSPAESAGLAGGDRIVAFDGTRVASLEEFAALLFGARAGQDVEIVYLRDGERRATRATLGRRR